jgi:hypothetical protein
MPLVSCHPLLAVSEPALPVLEPASTWVEHNLQLQSLVGGCRAVRSVSINRNKARKNYTLTSAARAAISSDMVGVWFKMRCNSGYLQL